MERVIDLVFDIFAKLEKNKQKLSNFYIVKLLHNALIHYYIMYIDKLMH
jgi:hypothetical protein